MGNLYSKKKKLANDKTVEGDRENSSVASDTPAEIQQENSTTASQQIRDKAEDINPHDRGAEKQCVQKSAMNLSVDEDNSKPRIALVPHIHSFFCERKQRVCQSVGKIQELEKVEFLLGDLDDGCLKNFSWVRIPAFKNQVVKDDLVLDEKIIAENAREYQLSKEDVDCFLQIRFKARYDESATDDQESRTAPIGPVLAGKVSYIGFICEFSFEYIYCFYLLGCFVYNRATAAIRPVNKRRLICWELCHC